MSDRKLKFGIIGCGTIANGKHMPNISKHPGAELVAFCDLKAEKAEKAAKEYGAPDARVYSDYRQLLADRNVEVVHVCTPNGLHCEMTVAAFEAGKHVLCEKPMATNEADAQKMIDAWKKSGKKFTIGFQWRFRAAILHLKEMCMKGELGEIYMAKASSVRRCGVPTWGAYLSREKQGGGALIDSGSHSLDLTLWLMNNYEPESVSGKVFRKLADRPEGNANGPWDPKDFTVDDSAFAHIKMKNGASLFLEASWLLNVQADMAHLPLLCGTKGGADLTDRGTLTINKIENGEPVTYKPEITNSSPFLWGPGRQGAHEVEHWIKAINEDTDPLVSPYEAIVVVKIIDAIYKSSETGETVYFK